MVTGPRELQGGLEGVVAALGGVARAERPCVVDYRRRGAAVQAPAGVGEAV